MIKFDVITIFPEIFDSYLSESLIARALKKKLLKIKVHNLRNWTKNKHKVVDDSPFGGGIGMVLKVEPIYRAIKHLTTRREKGKTESKKTKIILFTPRGKKFNQKMAYQFSKLDNIIFICGRYEGVDERVAKNIADIELSIGDYVLMGGELPAMAVIETVSRLIPGVLSKPKILEERALPLDGRGGKGFIEYVQYTRPETFSPKDGTNWRVPKVLLSGDHKKIAEWHEKNRKIIEK